MTPSGLHAACRPPSPPPSSSSSSSSAAAAATAPYCRVCFDGADDFVISPCKCTGTGAFIHKACLRRWQRVALASGNPERAHACGVCKAPYMQCYRLGRENAVRWAKNRSMADSEGQRQGGEEEDDEGKEGQVDGWLGRAAALLSPGCVVKSATLFALALVIPYAVLAYYGIMTLSYVDPLHCDGVGSGSAAQEALRRREREAAAAAVAPGRTVLVASSRIARGFVIVCAHMQGCSVPVVVGSSR